MPLSGTLFAVLSMIRPFISTCCVLLLTWGAGSVQAEKADRLKPMNIEADALRFDDVRQVSVFTGKVVLTKGTLVLRAARVDVKQDADGYQYGTAIAEPGARAFYRQKREGVDEYIEGEGEVIEYDGRQDLVKFIRRAEMRRYRGATLNDEMTGNIITYDNLRDVFTVDGRPPAGAAGAGVAGTRVRAVLTPAGAQAAPASDGAAALKTAPTLKDGAR